jgi:hypothetical protein
MAMAAASNHRPSGRLIRQNSRDSNLIRAVSAAPQKEGNIGNEEREKGSRKKVEISE